MTEALTDDERRALDLTVQLVDVVVKNVITDGPNRAGDLREFVHRVHGIQRMIMAQAAGRAYPTEYRLLGERLPDKP